MLLIIKQQFFLSASSFHRPFTFLLRNEIFILELLGREVPITLFKPFLNIGSHYLVTGVENKVILVTHVLTNLAVDLLLQITELTDQFNFRVLGLNLKQDGLEFLSLILL